LIKAPAAHYIRATIYHNLAGTEPSCAAGDRAYVSRDANYDFKGASYYCGNRMTAPLQVNSIGNELTLAVQTNSSAGRSFQVVLNIVKLVQTNCDCRLNFYVFLIFIFKFFFNLVGTLILESLEVIFKLNFIKSCFINFIKI
jgi:hypothetical protein